MQVRSAPFSFLLEGVNVMSQSPITHKSDHRPRQPPVLRLANRIREQILQRHARNTDGLQYQLANLKYRLEQVASIQRRLDLCQTHGFHLARVQVLEQLRYALRDLPHEINQVERSMPRDHQVLSLAEITKELAQLEEEFGPWRFAAEESSLIVTTEPIVLEDINLGSFEIRLHLSRLARSNNSQPYTVVALDPHCPNANEHVTHPHVSDDHLCEGDAAAAIHAALQEGRLCDFFVLVRSVLETYNRESPYVALESWYGTPCHDCGAVVDDDDRYFCESCDRDYCGDCISSCTECGNSRCPSCLEECSFCQDNLCGHCIEHCAQCGKSSCPSCLEEGVCPDCQEPPETPDTKEETHDDDNPPVSPVSPVSLMPATSGATSAANACAGGTAIVTRNGRQVQPSVRARRRHRRAQAA
jgi:hypothetical protein